MNEYGFLPGRYPAVVKTYDQGSRACGVEIPGLTDGSDVLLNAEIEYPIGEKSRSGDYTTEIEILPGDTVWISFIGGDCRYPIITGWRNPKSGNSVDWRRWHHANMELIADGMLRINATTVEINADNVIINGNTKITGDMLTHNNVNVGDDHKHSGVDAGSSNTGNPV